MDSRRERIEEWLPDEMPVVVEYCRAFGVPLTSWPDHPALGVFVDLALRRYVDELLVDLRARSQTAALQLAAPRFGLKPDSVARRWRRHRKAAKALRKISDDVSPTRGRRGVSVGRHDHRRTA